MQHDGIWTVGQIKNWLNKYNDNCEVVFHDRTGRRFVRGEYLDVVIGVITCGDDEE